MRKSQVSKGALYILCGIITPELIGDWPIMCAIQMTMLIGMGVFLIYQGAKP